MDLATFFTARIQDAQAQAPQTAGQNQAAREAALGSALNGVDAAGAPSGFFDQILEQLASELEPQSEEAAPENSLNIASLIGSTSAVQERIDANIARVDLGPAAEIQQALALNQQVNDEILLPLKGDTVRDGLSIPDAVNNDAPPSAAVSAFDDLILGDEAVIPEEISLASLLNGLNVGGEEQDAANSIDALVTKIETLTQGDDIPAFSALGLTPAQITKLQSLQAESKELEAVYDAQDAAQAFQESLDSIFQNSVSLTPPTAIRAGDEIIVPPQALPNTSPSALAEQQQLAARLNSLIVGGSADDALVTSDLNAVSNDGEGFDGDLEQILRQFGAKPATGNAAAATTTPDNAPAPQANNAAPALSFFQGEAFTSGGLLFSPSSFSSADGSNEFALPTISQSGVLNANNPAAILTQVPHASHAHPATQLVAATLQKAGVNGQDTNITLRLDPAELGRVDVRLQFGQDKNLKTVIRVENEDAFKLLQRDAQVLERALQDAGIDVNDGISFELAQDGDFGGQDNERGGGHENGGTGAGDTADAEDILETTLNWHIDPQSGHTRYDLLV